MSENLSNLNITPSQCLSGGDTDPALFFDYRCDQCGTPFCERVNIMNLTLGNDEEAYCLACLAGRYQRDEAAMAEFCWDYVQARDCFKTPWSAFDAHPCPRQADSRCFCQKEIPAP